VASAFRRKQTSDSQSLFQMSYPIPRDVDLGLLPVLEAEQHPAIHVGIEFLDKRHVDNGATMSTHESATVEALFELRQRVVDDVLASGDDSERQAESMRGHARRGSSTR
jgi:hypothetical protein